MFSEVCVRHVVAPYPNKEEATRLTIPARTDHNLWAACIDVRFARFHELGGERDLLTP